MPKMNMRAQFVKTMTDLVTEDPKAILLLGDIGVHGFRHLLRDHADRAYNIGILEQATIGLAAGMAMNDLIPVFHTIAPFIVERAYEQLKVDFGYQNLNGSFVSVGASYDYAGLGCTHHCPADVGALKLIPNMSIICPGTATEFDALFKQGFRKSGPKYFRLSEVQNEQSHDVRLGQANIVQQGNAGIVIAVGPMLSRITQACAGLDVSIVYYSSVSPFDSDALRRLPNPTGRIMVCEPYYSEGGLAVNVLQAFEGEKIAIKTIGIPTVFSTHYGTAKEHDIHHGLDADSIRKTIQQFLS